MPTPQTQISCLTCENRGAVEWCCLSDADLAVVDRGKTLDSYLPGSALYDQGEDCDGVYCLQSGLIGIRRIDENGNSALLRLVSPGETLGYRAFLRRAPHDNSAEALMPSSVCRIGRSTVRRLLQDNPELGLSFLDHSLRELTETESRYMESVTWKARTRLLHMLLVFNERFGTETENGEHRIELPISRQDLAGLIGTAPETMSRTIQRIQTEGLAQFNGRIVRIFDLDAICDNMPVAG